MKKEQSQCWHSLPVSSNQNFITNISLSWCLIATSIYSDVNDIYIFCVALRSLSKTNYPFGPHNITEQQVSQCIYYLLLRAGKDFINSLHIPPQLPLSWTEVISPAEFLLLWRTFIQAVTFFVPSLALPYLSPVIRTRITEFEGACPTVQ